MPRDPLISDVRSVFPDAQITAVEAAANEGSEKLKRLDRASREIGNLWIAALQRYFGDRIGEFHRQIVPFVDERTRKSTEASDAESAFWAKMKKIDRHQRAKPVSADPKAGKDVAWSRQYLKLLSEMELVDAQSQNLQRESEAFVASKAIENFRQLHDELQRLILECAAAIRTVCDAEAFEEINAEILRWAQGHPEFSSYKEAALRAYEEWRQQRGRKPGVEEERQDAEPVKSAPRDARKKHIAPLDIAKAVKSFAFAEWMYGKNANTTDTAPSRPQTRMETARGPQGGFSMTFEDATAGQRLETRIPFASRFQSPEEEPYRIDYAEKIPQLQREVARLAEECETPEDWAVLLGNAERGSLEMDKQLMSIFRHPKDRIAMCVAVIKHLDRERHPSVKITALKAVQQQWLLARLQATIRPSEPRDPLLATNTDMPFSDAWRLDCTGTVPLPADDEQLKRLIEEFPALCERSERRKEYVARIQQLLRYSNFDAKSMGCATAATDTFVDRSKQGWATVLVPVFQKMPTRSAVVSCMDTAKLCINNADTQTSVVARFQSEKLGNICAKEGKRLCELLLKK